MWSPGGQRYDTAHWQRPYTRQCLPAGLETKQAAGLAAVGSQLLLPRRWTRLHAAGSGASAQPLTQTSTAAERRPAPRQQPGLPHATLRRWSGALGSPTCSAVSPFWLVPLLCAVRAAVRALAQQVTRPAPLHSTAPAASLPFADMMSSSETAPACDAAVLHWSAAPVQCPPHPASLASGSSRMQHALPPTLLCELEPDPTEP